MRRNCVVPVKCLAEREHKTPCGWRLGVENQQVSYRTECSRHLGLGQGRWAGEPGLEAGGQAGRMAENMAYLPRHRRRVVPPYQVSRG